MKISPGKNLQIIKLIIEKQKLIVNHQFGLVGLETW